MRSKPLPKMHPNMQGPLLVLSSFLCSLVLVGSGSVALAQNAPGVPEDVSFSPESMPERTATPPPPSSRTVPIEYMDPSHLPLVRSGNPKCTVQVLKHDFGNTVGAAPVFVKYAPPAGCPAPWTRVVLDLSASASNRQKDRTAAVWIDGAEVLRTTTPVPMAPGVFWRIHKDVTRYSSLLRQQSFLSMMLENSIEDLPGVYSVNITLLFYRGPLHDMGTGSTPDVIIQARPSPGPVRRTSFAEPADLIIPISSAASRAGGFWFRLQNNTDVKTKAIVLPRNAYRAVLEVYASHHADDEYWYANPLGSNSLLPNADGLQSAKANGGFRQVVALIDGRFAGSAVPFPVIYPSSVNPFFWAPVAAIGAYDHPSYDLELTPFLGLLLDGNAHEFGLQVQDSQPYWLVSGNLHLWLDAWSDTVEAKLIRYKAPPLRLNRQADWEENEGKSDMAGEVIIRFSGWVSSSKGNLTTSTRHRVKFRSRVEVEEKGESRTVELENKSRFTMRVQMNDEVLSRMLVETDAPLHMMNMVAEGRGGGTRFRRTKLAHKLEVLRRAAEGKAVDFSAMTNRQESEGSVLMQDGAPMWGKGDTKSLYKFRDKKSCYLRRVNMVGGKVNEDAESASCAAAAAW